MKNIFDGLISEKRYLKLKQGENKFRIVQQPISGWLDWKDKKPYRYTLDRKPKAPFDAEKPIKPFLACYVWDYEQEGLFILELTQLSILKSLKGYTESEDWGDLRGFDLKIKRDGAGPTTKYAVEPVPPKPLSNVIKEALKASPVRLEAMYEGKDPWTDMETSDSESCESSSSLDTLKEYLEIEGFSTDLLEACITDIADKKGQSFDQVVESAVITEMLPKFKQAYVKYLLKVGAVPAAG